MTLPLRGRKGFSTRGGWEFSLVSEQKESRGRMVKFKRREGVSEDMCLGMMEDDCK